MGPPCGAPARRPTQARKPPTARMVVMRTDPSDTGGLVVWRRPGTAPVRFKAVPQRGTEARQRIDGSFAGLILAAMVAVSLLCWGPIPIANVGVSSQVNYLTG